MADRSAREVVGVFLQRLPLPQPRVLILTNGVRREFRISVMYLKHVDGKELPNEDTVPDREIELVLQFEEGVQLKFNIAGTRKIFEAEHVSVLSLGCDTDLIVFNRIYPEYQLG